MSTGKADVSGSFQLSTFVEGGTVPQSNGSGATTIRARGKGSMHVKVTLSDNTIYNSTLQMSSEESRTLSVFVAIGQTNTNNESAETSSATTKNVAIQVKSTGVTISKIESACSGKIDSANINYNDTEWNSIADNCIAAMDTLTNPYSVQQLYDLFGEGGAIPTVTLATAAPGRGHLGAGLA